MEEQHANTSAQEVPLKKKKNTLTISLERFFFKTPTSEAGRAAAELADYLLEDVIDLRGGKIMKADSRSCLL